MTGSSSPVYEVVPYRVVIVSSSRASFLGRTEEDGESLPGGARDYVVVPATCLPIVDFTGFLPPPVRPSMCIVAHEDSRRLSKRSLQTIDRRSLPPRG